MPFHLKLQLEEHKQAHSRVHIGEKRSADSSEPFGKRIEGGFALPGTQTDFRGEKLEEGPWFLSSLKKEFSEETNIVKKIKAFIRSTVHVEKSKYM